MIKPDQAEVKKAILQARKILNANAAPKAMSKTDLDNWAKLVLDGSGHYSGKAASNDDGGFGLGDIVDGAKSVGSTTLKALSVPQAIAFTGLQNQFRFATGKPLISWKNLGGSFYKNYKGGAGLLETAGIKNKTLQKWGGLGLDIAADPLWFVAPTKIATAPQAVARVAKAAEEGKKVESALKGVEKVARSTEKTDDVREAMKIAFGGKEAPKKISQAKITVKSEAKKMKVQNKAHGIAKPTVQAEIINGDLAVTKIGGKWRVLKVKDAGHLRGDEELLASFKNLHEATGFAKKQSLSKVDDAFKNIPAPKLGAPEATQADIFKATSKQPKVAGPISEDTKKALANALAPKTASTPQKEKLLDNLFDEHGNIRIAQAVDAMAETGRRAEQLNSREAARLGIRLGTKKHGKTIATPITFTQKSLAARQADKAGGALGALKELFSPAPLDKAARSVARSANEISEDVPRIMQKVRQQFKGMSDLDAQLAYMVAAARNVNVEYGNRLREVLQEQGVWNKLNDDALDYFRRRWDQMAEVEGRKTSALRGPYAPQGPKAEWIAEKRLSPEAATSSYQSGRILSKPDADYKRIIQSPFQYLSRDEFITRMADEGLDEGVATKIANAIEDATPIQNAAKGLDGEAKAFLEELASGAGFKAADSELASIPPEFDLFKLGARREQDLYRSIARSEIDKLAVAAGVARVENGKVVYSIPGGARELMQSARMTPAGPVAETKIAQGLQTFTAKWKGLVTSVNPAYYVRNAAGDYINSLVYGNFGHLKGLNASNPKGLTFKLAKKDKAALEKTYKVGDRTYTGEELVVISHFAGLGKGYVAEDIMWAFDALKKARGPYGKWRDFALKMNQTREDSQRLSTWMRHMNAGDDPWTAAAKTVSTHFDYGDLSKFEKVFVRNLLMFYGWLKFNSILQVKGIATRPALYNAVLNAFERARPDWENEPPYLAQLGLIPTPFGGIDVGNPLAHVYKFDISRDSLRKNLLSGLNPAAKIPIEYATNRSLFSGQDIEKFPGQNVPRWYGPLFNALGVGQPSRTYADGPKSGAVPAPLANFIDSLAGPQNTNLGVAMSPDYQGTDEQQGVELLGRVLGVKPVFEKADQWRAINEGINARKKADQKRKERLER